MTFFRQLGLFIELFNTIHEVLRCRGVGVTGLRSHVNGLPQMHETLPDFTGLQHDDMERLFKVSSGAVA